MGSSGRSATASRRRRRSVRRRAARSASAPNPRPIADPCGGRPAWGRSWRKPGARFDPRGSLRRHVLRLRPEGRLEVGPNTGDDPAPLDQASRVSPRSGRCPPAKLGPDQRHQEDVEGDRSPRLPDPQGSEPPLAGEGAERSQRSDARQTRTLPWIHDAHLHAIASFAADGQIGPHRIDPPRGERDSRPSAVSARHTCDPASSP